MIPVYTQLCQLLTEQLKDHTKIPEYLAIKIADDLSEQYKISRKAKVVKS